MTEKFAEMATDTTFEAFGFKSDIMEGIKEAGFKIPSPIQAEAIPLILQGRDVIAQSHTGTGKTAAFGLPVMNNMLRNIGIELIVISPTRELAAQISDELYRLGKFAGIRTCSILGGHSYSRQLKLLESGTQVLAATPGRLLDMLRSGKIDESHGASGERQRAAEGRDGVAGELDGSGSALRHGDSGGGGPAGGEAHDAAGRNGPCLRTAEASCRTEPVGSSRAGGGDGETALSERDRGARPGGDGEARRRCELDAVDVDEARGRRAGSDGEDEDFVAVRHRRRDIADPVLRRGEVIVRALA